MRVALKYGATLIALYIVVYNGSKAGTVMKSGAAGIATVTAKLQGR